MNFPFSDPIAAFKAWFSEAKASESHNPDAMTLATLGPDGVIRSRVVLLKGQEGNGFDFYTNYSSQKGRDLAANTGAALSFYWKSLDRQIRIEGQTIRLPETVSDSYWASRPRGSQLGAWASQQSEVCDSRQSMTKAMQYITQKYADHSDVPRPEFWGGYRLAATRLEFWAQQPDRFHDRWAFARAGDRWARVRLWP